MRAIDKTLQNLAALAVMTVRSKFLLFEHFFQSQNNNATLTMNLVYNTSPQKQFHDNWARRVFAVPASFLLPKQDDGFKFTYQPPVNCHKRKRNDDSDVYIPNKRFHSEPSVQLVNHFHTLPEEITSYIFSYLDYKNVCILAQVSLKFHQCAHQEILWLDLYKRRWFNNPVDDLWLRTKRVHPEKLFMMRRRIEIAYLNSLDAKNVETNSKTFHRLAEWFYNEASNLSNLDPERAEWLFICSFQEYSSSYVLNPDDYEILVHWGDALSDFALLKQGSERDLLFFMSQQRYEVARRIMPVVEPTVDPNDIKFGSVDLRKLNVSWM